MTCFKVDGERLSGICDASKDGSLLCLVRLHLQFSNLADFDIVFVVGE